MPGGCNGRHWKRQNPRIRRFLKLRANHARLLWFWDHIQPDRLSYVQHLTASAPQSKLAKPSGGRLPPNVQPSLLQLKLCTGANQLSSCLQPCLTPDGLGLMEPPVPSALQALPVQQQQAPQGSNSSPSQGHGLVNELTTCWALISLPRCAELTREMDISVPLYSGSIYQPELLSTVWDADRKLRPLRSLFTAVPHPQLTFRAGPLPARPPPFVPYSAMPTTMIARRDQAYLLATARMAMLEHLDPLAFKQSKSKGIKAVGIAAKAAAAAPPSTATSNHQPAPGNVAAPDGLWCSSIPWGGSAPAAAATAGLGDAALAALPDLLDDPVLLDELTAKWWGRCRALAALLCVDQDDCLLSSCVTDTVSIGLPTRQQLVAALRASILEVAPLLHCSTLPPAHISNFVEHHSHRAQVAAKFCRVLDAQSGQQLSGRHPVEALSAAGHEFVYRPFDVAETRVSLLDELAACKWSRC
eukprot:gene9265-9430_t